MDFPPKDGGKINHQPSTASVIIQLPDHHELTVLTSRWDSVAKGYLKEAKEVLFYFFFFFLQGKRLLLHSEEERMQVCEGKQISS